MKRKIDICRKCPHYSKAKALGTNMNICMKADFTDHPEGVIGITVASVDGTSGIYVLQSNKDFENEDITVKCDFYTEYCLNEWNRDDEKKA